MTAAEGSDYTSTPLGFAPTDLPMHRSTVRLFAVVILALLGAPVAMHVIVHDLHEHHAEHAKAYDGEAGHGDHEHPLVSSSAPQVPSLAPAALPVVAAPASVSAVWTRIATGERNVVSVGALRMDDDVGLQLLLSTFLI